MKIDTFKTEEWMNKYEKYAKYDMTCTCVNSFSLEELFKLTETDLSDFLKTTLDYGDITGSDELKRLISGLYLNKTPDNVTVTIGTIGANQLVYLSLLEKGDEVICVIPTYQQHYSVPKQLGAEVKLLKLKEELNWHIDFDELKNLITDKTKMIILNNPNNPTGSVMSYDELHELTAIADKYGIYVLCDEVYKGLNHYETDNKISIADIYDRGISTSSLSKTYSLAGIRVGYVVSNKAIIDEINHQRQYNTISVSRIDDYIACIALRNGDKIIKRNLKTILEGKKVLMEWINSRDDFSVVEPKAGTTAFLKYNFNMNSTEFSEQLFKDTSILFLPGEAFEFDKHLRIGYCGDIENLREGLNITSNWLDKNLKTAGIN
ncbi:aminotransferase class I/II-fold pyridoxal phosphate-dependent enzyme [bacterium]|nr:aminotransferase class I/II-fold pyridoxal phosphate-dependent enzyme [bacterium]